MIERSQEAVSFPYYDLVPLGDLHLTLDRVAFESDLTPEHLRAINAAATLACREISPFSITVDSLGGTPGAIGFSASPARPIVHLRDTLREATLSVYPDARIKNSELHPHVTIAYCNSSNVPAEKVVAAVENLSMLSCTDIWVKESSLVLLEQRPRAYAWHEIFRIPLGDVDSTENL
ncbi:2'-5' RNA ligase family protein [Nonomuraea insulae]|uniref:2'-5' RNA ligase family protein n=1 Tax=Nonomuraea insulae TaxID=1616787 RepID=A0ABW1CQ17_9ACTN